MPLSGAWAEEGHGPQRKLFGLAAIARQGDPWASQSRICILKVQDSNQSPGKHVVDMALHFLRG